MCEERRVRSSGRLQVTEELVGADEQVRRDEHPDPPVVEDDSDQTQELGDEEPKAVGTDQSNVTGWRRGSSFGVDSLAVDSRS